jgi:hypothetical protein
MIIFDLGVTNIKGYNFSTNDFTTENIVVV